MAQERLTWTLDPRIDVFVKAKNLVEGTAIGSPDVLLEQGQYFMVYAQGGTDLRGRIGLAESSDALSWTRVDDGRPILEPGPAGSWDAQFLDTPCLLRVGGLWYLWYYGSPTNDTPGACLGLATSIDGRTWTKDPSNPILRPGPAGSWDGLWVESPSVRWDGRQFQMLYTGIDASWLIRVGHASSPDGRTWTKDAANPVLDRGPDLAWDDFAAAVPNLVALPQGGWELFYCSQSAFETALGWRVPKVGRATSPDLTTWTRDPANPLFGPWQTGNRANGPWTPSAIFDPKTRTYWIWYETGTGFGLIKGRPP